MATSFEDIRFRSLLFVPGNRADMLQKATRNSPGAFIPIQNTRCGRFGYSMRSLQA